MTTTTDSISIQAAKEHPLPDFAPGQQIGGYEVICRLDEGMIGAVYKVRRVSNSEVVALKLIRPQLLPRGMDSAKFDHAIQVIAQVTHPGLVRILESGQHAGLLFFTMEFVEGKSLRSVMSEYRARGEDMPHLEMLNVLQGVLEILNDIHPGSIHRNLKPENILLIQTVGEDGRTKPAIKLTDFGIAQVVSFAETALNREGAWYLAPEMSEFRDKASPSSDLYSLGAIVYEMLTGFPPLGRYELPSAIRQGEMSAKVDDLVEIALEANPQDRFRNADDMLAAVDETFADLYGGGQAPLIRMLVLLGLLAVVVTIAILYFQSQSLSPEEVQAMEEAYQSSARAQNQAQYATPGDPTQADSEHPEKYENMAWIPPGTFLAGSWTTLAERGLGKTEEKITLPGYWIDIYEHHVPEIQPVEGESAEEAAERQARNMEEAWKVIGGVSHAQAVSICQQQHKRLCSAFEWEKACKGEDLGDYSYGDTYDKAPCGDRESIYRASSPYKVNQFPACTNSWRAQGMSGGVLEWTGSAVRAEYIVKPSSSGGESGSKCAAVEPRRPDVDGSMGVRCCAE
ncbi:MAG: bifunctional serine/threonine-protein kinase/formylglycine-generating enzyme family protein [Myxococcota bacterium]|nr:bifunctional serine/threonine-protein kinase/formylglycine-generating enzyme family protein [Myxococcota bacterium]